MRRTLDSKSLPADPRLLEHQMLKNRGNFSSSSLSGLILWWSTGDVATHWVFSMLFKAWCCGYHGYEEPGESRGWEGALINLTGLIGGAPSRRCTDSNVSELKCHHVRGGREGGAGTYDTLHTQLLTCCGVRPTFPTCWCATPVA